MREIPSQSLGIIKLPMVKGVVFVMKLGVMTVLLGDLSLDETLKYLKSLGVQEVEIGCGGTPGTAHAVAVKFMEHPELIEQFQETVAK